MHLILDEMPASELRTWAEYLAKSPSAEFRIEATVAQLAAIYRNAHVAEGTTPKGPSDFLLFKKDPWDTSEGDDPMDVFASIAGAI